MTRVSAAIREQVRQRAGERCEYCRKPEMPGTYPHHIEHIVALKHGGSSDLDNLAWACFQCNVAKGSDVASYDEQTGELTPLYNPRRQEWDDQFRLDDDADIVGITPVGHVTARLLQINHPDQVETRRQLIRAGVW